MLEDKNKSISGITNVAEKELDLLSRHLDVLKIVKDYAPVGFEIESWKTVIMDDIYDEGLNSKAFVAYLKDRYWESYDKL